MSVSARELALLVIRIADEPTADSTAELMSALPGSALFLKVTGLSNQYRAGDTLVVGRSEQLQVVTAQLPNGKKMVSAYCAPPRANSSERIVSLPAMEVLKLVANSSADGLVISAGDQRQSWTAIVRATVIALLAGC